MSEHDGIDYTVEDIAVFNRLSPSLLIPQLGGDRNDAAMMALREREKARAFTWEAWHSHRREWFPARWGSG
jgi:hypothetical protein